MAFHQVIQYYEDEQGLARIVQRGDSDANTGRVIARERRDSPSSDWREVAVLGEYLRTGHVDGNKSAPEQS
jgi:hypothetical protein